MMKCAVLTGSGHSEVITMPKPSINETEVLIKVLLCGLCTSETQTWLHDNGSRRLLGHEVVGVIEELGSEVVGFKEGDRVTGMIYQGYAQYAKADYRMLVKIPEKLEACEALGEPLSCLITGIDRISNLPCKTAAVIGAGYMGLGMIQLLKWKGAEEVIAIDVRDESLENSRRFGADILRHPNEVEAIYKVVDWDQMDRGVPVVVEISGSQSGLELAGQMTAVHGTMAITGYHQGGPRTVNMELWNWKALTVINAHERRDAKHLAAMKVGLSLVEQGLFQMKPMVTHSFPLEALDEGFRTLMAKPEGFIKAVITMD